MIAQRTITNRLADCELFDLSKLMGSKDGRGPFLLVQEGCDPGDPRMRECSFVLTHRGTWLHYYLYLALPESVRRRCALFERANEAMQRVESLPDGVRVEDAHSLQELLHEHGFEPDPSDLAGKALLERLRQRHPDRASSMGANQTGNGSGGAE
jgi:hypothetical protein